jgi:ferric-dicitrate binding protein FerR (iron transport regulator)
MASPEGEAFFKRLSLEEWGEHVQADKTQQQLHRRWKKELNSKIKSLEADKPSRINLLLRNMTVRYAAVWIAVLLVSSLLFWKWQTARIPAAIVFIEQTNTKGVPVRYVLPDSSEVYLAAGSNIRYPEHFEGATRAVDLTGEAFFHVKHNPERPFIVKTGNMYTRVLGTSFKVTAFKKEALKVEVATGKVSVYAKNEDVTKELGILTPGLDLAYNETTGMVRKGTIETGVLENWKTGELVFENQTLRTVTEELARRYAVNIVFMDEKTADYRISASFGGDENVDQILHRLSKMGKFRVKNERNQNYELYRN